MKRNAIARLVIWSVAACICLGVLLWGLLAPGFSLSWNLGGWSSYTYKDADQYTVGAGSVDGQVHSLSVNWVSGSVTLRVGDVPAVEIAETPQSQEKYQVRYLLRDGNLTIRPYASGWWMHMPTKDLTVTLPADLAANLNSLHLHTVSAAVTLTDVGAKTMQLDTVSGSLYGTGVTAGRLETDTVSGQVQLQGQVDAVEMDTVSGDMILQNARRPEQLSTDAVSGNVYLSFPDSGGFTALWDTVSGQFSSDFQVTLGKTMVYGDGSGSFSFDSVSGDVTLTCLPGAADAPEE